MTRFERVAVIGAGLIGGSFALALKSGGLCDRVTGAGRSAGNLGLALARGAIDSVAHDAAAAADGADLVFVATPVAQFPEVFEAIGKTLKPGAIVTDAGSTKRDVVAAARKALGAKLAQFVPGHPIAGAEASGVAAASADLFRGRRTVLTPLAQNPASTVETLRGLWQAIGAKVSSMSPEEHDEVFAAVSHLPHLLAYALVQEIAGRPNSAQLFGYAASGFRDFTRIASSHPEMWRDICIANRDLLLKEMERFSAQLNGVRKLLEARDAAALEKLFAGARAARGRWLNGDYEP